jgi:MFS family permease
MSVAGLLGRIPMSMVTLGVTLLVVQRSTSYALAGAVTGTQTLAMALVAPYGSRLADRWGQTRTLPLLVGVHAVFLLLLLTAILRGWAWFTWIGLAAGAGASLPMMGAMVRARWSEMIPDPGVRSSAFALESAADEVALIVGPLLASALAFGVSPAWAVLAAVGLLLVGGVGLAVQGGTAPRPGAPRRREGGHPLRQAGMPEMAALMLFVGGVFGSFQVSTVAFGQASDPAWTGGLLAAFSVGSLTSGLWLAARRRDWSLTWQVRVALVTLTVTLVPLTLVRVPLGFAPIAVLAGLSVSVVMVGAFGLVERLVPESRVTESLSSVTAAVALGMSAGSWLGGLAVDTQDASLGFAMCVTSAGLAAVVMWLSSGRLRALERRADHVEPVVA